MKSAVRRRLRRILLRTLVLSLVAAIPVGLYYYKTFFHLRRALPLLRAGDREGGKAELRAHLRLNPGDTAARIELARLHRADHEYEALLAALTETPNLSACTDEPCLHAGALRIAALLEMERLGEAERELEAREARAPTPEIYELRYRERLFRQDFAGARAALEAGLAKHPDEASLNILKAREMAAQGDVGGGAARIREAARRAPKDQRPSIYVSLGSYFQDNGDDRNAEAAYKQALAIDETSYSAHDFLGLLYILHGRHQDALDHFLRAIELNPLGLMTRYHNAGRMAVELGQWDLAEKLFRKMMELSPAEQDLALADLWLLRKARATSRGAAPDRPIRVEFRATAQDEPPARLSIAGSWTPDGKYADAEAWRYEPMESADGRTWTRTVALDPRAPFGYGFVLDDDDDPATGALYFDRLALDLMESFPDSVRVEIALSPERREPPAPAPRWRQKPGDGRQAVFVFWLDAGTWHILAPLLARGRAPAAAQFLEDAAYGGLWAEKAWTAKAIQALTTFNRAETYTLLNLVSDVIREMQANAAVGQYFNFVQPATLTYLEGQTNLTIWDVVERNRRVALNMIFSDRGVFDPNDAVLFTAEGKREQVAALAHGAPSAHGFEYDEATLAVLARFLGAAPADRSRGFMHRYIAENYRDAELKQRMALEAVRKHHPEFTVLRYPELDHISHYFFDSRRQTVPGDQGGSQPGGYGAVLENFYVYYDGRLSEMLAETDEDDAVFIISDHGMASNFDHGPLALLMARGPAIAARGFVGVFDNHDFPKTILRLAGMGVPEAPNYGVMEPLFDPAAGRPGAFGPRD